MAGILPPLPLHPTPEYPHGSRAHVNHRQPEHQSWNYLRGEGPSSSDRYHDPLEKHSFKPGWQQMRRASAIQPDAERKQQEAIKDVRCAAAQQARMQQTAARALDHGFNPITGQEYNKQSSSWQPASNPWSHQRVGMRPTATIAAMHAAHGAPPLLSLPHAGGAAAHAPTKAQALSSVSGMRQDRIANQGLTATLAKRPGGGVKELMQWS